MINLVADAHPIIAKRADITHIGDKRVDLPCVSVFKMCGRKIGVWRDYFDIATYISAFLE